MASDLIGIPSSAADGESPSLQGLDDAEARHRLRTEGPNEISSPKSRNLLVSVAAILREPMIFLLVLCGGVYLLIGDLREALVLLASILLVIGISLHQSRKAERAIQALRDLSSPKAWVIRGGARRRVPGREVVRGDLLVLSEGDRVGADGVLLQSMNMAVDESLLTGESVPVPKSAGPPDAEMARPGVADTPSVYSGTLVVAGEGIASVKATGSRSELGRIGKSLLALEPEETNLNRRIGRLVRVLAVLGLAVCSAVAILYGLSRHDWLSGLLAGLALAISMLPEEFPVILTIFLALGAWRIARRNVLTRRMPAIEALGSATVLCLDKTGTLTENQMSVAALCVGGRRLAVDRDRDVFPQEFQNLIEVAVLGSRTSSFDRMEQSILELAEKALHERSLVRDGSTLIRQYPLSPALRAMSHVWKTGPDGGFVVAAKGAPEAVALLCRLDVEQRTALDKDVGALAREGLRVLGVAHTRIPQGPLPASQSELRLSFDGLVAFSDPIRRDVPETVKALHRAGIRTVMITGDYPGTAVNIATKAGFEVGGGVITGPEMDGMDDDQLARRVRTTAVFARVVPDQKLRIVTTLKRLGEIVAMTGDGVNDAPALKAAHVGVAMGRRGTDVAREAAALVLLDDDISSIVHAVRLGRRILDNIKKAVSYVLAMHVPIAGLSLIPVLFEWPLVLLPVHIVLLELLIDPACSVALEAEPEEPNVMSRPPREPDEPLLRIPAMALSLLQGLFVLALALTTLVLAMSWGHDTDRSRAMAFSVLILGNVALILVNRSESRTTLGTLRIRNRALWALVGGALLVLVLCLAMPAMRSILRLGELSAGDLATIFGMGLACLVGLDALKLMALKIRRESGAPDSKTPEPASG